jgi:hypothetical protein
MQDLYLYDWDNLLELLGEGDKWPTSETKWLGTLMLVTCFHHIIKVGFSSLPLFVTFVNHHFLFIKDNIVQVLTGINNNHFV